MPQIPITDHYIADNQFYQAGTPQLPIKSTASRRVWLKNYSLTATAVTQISPPEGHNLFISSISIHSRGSGAGDHISHANVVTEGTNTRIAQLHILVNQSGNISFSYPMPILVEDDGRLDLHASLNGTALFSIQGWVEAKD